MSDKKKPLTSPDTSSMDYKYGIFFKLKDSGSRGWSNTQVREWCDKNDVHYEDTDKREDLVERIKQAGYK